MASLDLPTKPEAIDCDGKNDDVSRPPASPSPRASQRERDRNRAGKAKSRQCQEGRRRKRTEGGPTHRSPRPRDRNADKKALPTTGKVNKKADADCANVSAKSSGKSKPTGTKMPRNSPSSPSSLGHADHSVAVLAAAPAVHVTERDEVPEHSKKSGDVAQTTAPTARKPDAFGPSHLAGHTSTAETDVERGHGFRLSNSRTTLPVETLQYDTSPVTNDAMEAAGKRRRNYGTVQQDSFRRHSAVPVDAVLAPSGPKGSTEKLIPSTPPTTTPSPKAILSGRYPVAGETAHPPPETLADSAESEGQTPWRGRIMKIIKNESVDGAGATNSAKHVPALANVKSRYSGTADYQVTLRRLRMGLFANERDEPSGPSPARRTLILLPLAALMVALVLVLLARKSRIVHKLSSVYIHDESGVCSTEACHRVVAFAMENTDAAFDPCVDFHRHACGRWFAGSTARRSYVDENRVNFSAAAHRALTQLLLRPQPGGDDIPHDDVGMARFYASCLAYGRKRPRTRVPVVLERMGLNKSLWTDFTSLQQLFDHLVAANFRTGLAGLVRVSKDDSAANGLLVVDVGESLQSTLGDHTTWFLSSTLRELDWPKNHSLIAALQSLDARVERARSQVNDSLPLDATSVGENAASLGLGLFWEDALEHAFSASNESSNVTNAVVSAGAVDALKGMIAALTAADLRVAGFYSLLLMLAQVMKYPYQLATNYAGFEDVTLCLQATGEHMSAQFASWLARSLEGGETPAYLDKMVAALNQAIETSTWLHDNLALNIADVPDRLMVKTAGSVINKGCIANPTVTPEKSIYSDDFVANILLARKTGAPSCLRAGVAATVRSQLVGRIEPDPAGALVAPTAALTPDLLHADAGEPSLDYSTLGVMLLIEWAHVVSARRPALRARLSEYGQCVRRDATDLLMADNVSDASLRTMLFLPWALDLALAAATSQWRTASRRARAKDVPFVEDSATERLRVQLFFRRFCQMTCGDKEAVKVCLYGMLRSSQFARTFQCTWPEKDADC